MVAPPTAAVGPAAVPLVAQRLPNERGCVRRRRMGRGGQCVGRSVQKEVYGEVEVVSDGGACVDEVRVGMAAKHPEQRREEVERRQMQRRLEGRRCGYLPGQGGYAKTAIGPDQEPGTERR